MPEVNDIRWNLLTIRTIIELMQNVNCESLQPGCLSRIADILEEPCENIEACLDNLIEYFGEEG